MDGWMIRQMLIATIDLVNDVDNTFVAIRIINEDKTRGIETIDRKDHKVQCTVYYQY